MKATNQNPPAFPNDADNTEYHQIFDGMSLRDYFAAHKQLTPTEIEAIKKDGYAMDAKIRFGYAEAMLAERLK